MTAESGDTTYDPGEIADPLGRIWLVVSKDGWYKIDRGVVLVTTEQAERAAKHGWTRVPDDRLHCETGHSGLVEVER